MTFISRLRRLALICLAIALTPALAGAASVTLAWTAPVQNEDSSQVEDLAGFNLYLRPDTNFVPSQDIIVTMLEGVNPAPSAAEEYSVEVDVAQTVWFSVTAVDYAGNESAFSTPLLVDMLAPVIALQGANPLTLDFGTAFAEPGWTAQDDVEGDLAAEVIVTGMVDPNTPGTYYLHYNVADSSGNLAVEQIREVRVADAGDLTAPVIILIGSNPLTLDVGSAFFDPGYSASDNLDGDLTSQVQVTGTVNHNALGTYLVRYNVSDSSGNPAAEVVRTVHVVDRTAPVLALLGDNPMSLEFGTPYTEPGYTATDNFEGNLTAQVEASGSVNHTSLGTYTRRYNVQDSSGNAASELVRTVHVVDTTGPNITLNGANPMEIPVGIAFVEPGFSALDQVDGNLTASVTVSGSVNTSVPGTYTVRYNVNDSSGNAAAERIRVVNVVDLTAPIITLSGANPLTLPLGVAYTEPGYSAIDNIDGDLTAQVQVTGSVDHEAIGIYEMTYAVTDSSGNDAAEKTRTVRVVDASAPTILLDGDNPLTLEYGAPYVEPGFSAQDETDGDITGDVQVSGSVNHLALGTYQLSYNVSDASGNEAPEVIRTVHVVDTMAPTLQLTGPNPVNLPVGGSYIEPGFSAQDNVDGDLTSQVTVSGTVNTGVPGTYVLRYNVQDASGNAALERTRTVLVVDSTAPSIVLTGANPLSLSQGTPYVEPGYTASDNADGDLTSQVQVTGFVNHNAVGTYQLRYNVSDSSGNHAPEQVRVIHVLDQAAPVIQLLGANPLTVDHGSAYSEPGYIATDDVDGNLTAQVQVTGTVDTGTPGIYYLNYNVMDSSGNAAGQVTRTVNVVDRAKPVITLSGANPLTLPFGVPYSEPGFTATDAADGDLTGDVHVSGTVDHTTLGTYLLRYNVSDSSGNTANQRTRTIYVVDTQPPQIVLAGANPMDLNVGDTFIEPGYTATDNADGNLTGSVTVSGAVNTSVPGTYTLSYDVQDSSGNAAVQRVRTVRVRDVAAPIITLQGSNPMILYLGTPYNEPGFTAVDDVDGDISAQVEVTGSVNPDALGQYELRYNVADSSGNAAVEQVRMVQVLEDPTEPPTDSRPLAPTGLIEKSRSPEFTWESVPGAEWYQVDVDKEGSDYYSKWYQATSFTPTWALAPGEYTWAVRTWNEVGMGDWSETAAFSIEAHIPDPPTSMLPAGAIYRARPLFRWDDMEHADWYQLIVQRSGKSVVNTWIETESQYRPPEDEALRYGKYAWWVRGWGIDGMGAWSEGVEFDYGVLQPNAPLGEIATRRPDFTWEALFDAEWYQIWIGRHGEHYYDLWLPSPTWSPDWDLPDGEYEWYVRAWNERGTGPWSEAGTFALTGPEGP